MVPLSGGGGEQLTKWILLHAFLGELQGGNVKRLEPNVSQFIE